MNPLILVFPDGKRIKFDSISAYDTISNSGKDLTIHTNSDVSTPYAYTFASAQAATLAASMIDNLAQSGSSGNVTIPALSSLPAFSSIKWSTDSGVTWNNSPAPKNNINVWIQVNGSNLNAQATNVKGSYVAATILLTGAVPPPYSTDISYHCVVDTFLAASVVSKNKSKFSFAANTYDLSLLDPNGNVLFTQASAIVFS